jgi:hypothetical protein
MANIDQYQWDNRPRTPGSATQRILILDRGGAIYKWDGTSDWTLDSTNVALLVSSGVVSTTGDVSADQLPATVLASATLALAKITGGGTDGSAVFVNGLLTTYTAPT